jgi:hypothetical protein
MLYRSHQDHPPYPRITQQPNGCVPTTVALGASLVKDLSPYHLAEILHRDLRPGPNGSTFDEAADALARYQISSQPHLGYPLRQLLEFHSQGSLILGIDASRIYLVPSPSFHAVLIARVALPVVPARMRALLRDFPEVIPPIEIIDPEGRVPERHTVPFEILELAYDEAGQQALFIPGIRFES